MIGAPMICLWLWWAVVVKEMGGGWWLEKPVNPTMDGRTPYDGLWLLWEIGRHDNILITNTRPRLFRLFRGKVVPRRLLYSIQ